MPTAVFRITPKDVENVQAAVQLLESPDETSGEWDPRAVAVQQDPHCATCKCFSEETSRKLPPREFDIESHQGLYSEKAYHSVAGTNRTLTCERCGGSGLNGKGEQA